MKEMMREARVCGKGSGRTVRDEAEAGCETRGRGVGVRDACATDMTHGLSSKPLNHSRMCSLGGDVCLVVPLKKAHSVLRRG